MVVTPKNAAMFTGALARSDLAFEQVLKHFPDRSDEVKELIAEHRREVKLATMAMEVFHQQLGLIKVTREAESPVDLEQYEREFQAFASSTSKLGLSARDQRVRDLARNYDRFVRKDEGLEDQHMEPRRVSTRRQADSSAQSVAKSRAMGSDGEHGESSRREYPRGWNVEEVRKRGARKAMLEGLKVKIERSLKGRGDIDKPVKNFIVDCVYPLAPEEFVDRWGEEVRRWVKEYKERDDRAAERRAREREEESLKRQEEKRQAAERRRSGVGKKRKAAETSDQGAGGKGHATRGARAAKRSKQGKPGTAASSSLPKDRQAETAGGSGSTVAPKKDARKKKKRNPYFDDLESTPESEEGQEHHASLEEDSDVEIGKVKGKGKGRAVSISSEEVPESHEREDREASAFLNTA